MKKNLIYCLLIVMFFLNTPFDHFSYKYPRIIAPVFPSLYISFHLGFLLSNAKVEVPVLNFILYFLSVIFLIEAGAYLFNRVFKDEIKFFDSNRFRYSSTIRYSISLPIDAILFYMNYQTSLKGFSFENPFNEIF